MEIFHRGYPCYYKFTDEMFNIPISSYLAGSFYEYNKQYTYITMLTEAPNKKAH